MVSIVKYDFNPFRRNDAAVRNSEPTSSAERTNNKHILIFTGQKHILRFFKIYLKIINFSSEELKIARTN